VRQTVFRSIDPVTGRPDVDPNAKPTTGGPMRTFCPSAHGGKNWPPAAFNPQTRMIYLPANNNMCGAMTGVPVTYTAGRGYSGVQYGGNTVAPGADHFGEVQAWNVDTGQRVWMHPYPKNINWGSMLTTGGNLVFSGGTGDKKMHAFDATRLSGPAVVVRRARPGEKLVTLDGVERALSDLLEGSYKLTDSPK